MTLAVMAGCSGAAASPGNGPPGSPTAQPAEGAVTAPTTAAASAAAEQGTRPSLDSPAAQRAALGEVAAACAIESGQRAGPCTKLCDLERSPCTDKLETLAQLVRSAEPPVRVAAIELAFEVVRECDCGDPHEQLSCLPDVNLCERLGWYAQEVLNALETVPRELRGRVLATMHRRKPDPQLVVPALRRLLKNTALAASPPAADDAKLAHRALVALWGYGTTAQSARKELYAIIRARPSPRLVADALVGLASSELVQLGPGIPQALRSVSDRALLGTLERALGDANHLVQSGAALALQTLLAGRVDLGKTERRLAAWTKRADARAKALLSRGPVRIVAEGHAESAAERPALMFYLNGPFLTPPLAVGTRVSILQLKPGPAVTAPVASIKRVEEAPGYFERHVRTEPVAAPAAAEAGSFRPPILIHPEAPRAQSLAVDSVDPALLPAGVNHDGLYALGDVDGDGAPDVAFNMCCGGVAWIFPYAEPHPDSKSSYSCMANGGVWLRDKVGWHRVHLLLPM